MPENSQKPSSNSNLPKDLGKLKEFKVILNPIRLTMVILLHDYVSLSASELRQFMDIPWGTFESHVKRLVKEGIVLTERKFIRGSPRIILFLTDKGYVKYRELKSLLQSHI